MNIDRVIKVKATLLKKGNNTPLNENGVKVRLYDKDLISDDFLGEVVPDIDGVVSFTFTEKDLRSFDSPNEKDGDYYFKVFINNTETYKSPVALNVDPAKHGTLKAGEGLEIDLGTFLIS